MRNGSCAWFKLCTRLFIFILEVLSREFLNHAPWELLNADDLVIVGETGEELRRNLSEWKKRDGSKRS